MGKKIFKKTWKKNDDMDKFDSKKRRNIKRLQKGFPPSKGRNNFPDMPPESEGDMDDLIEVRY